ncbi:hypothetical protein I5H37_gp085 [Mycobacterium phage Filuzino]|uniref:Uncharacterized protein n=1 Tax=Mycobacterium phage Filuzino TaxID=2484209 RepID=A0A3G3LZ44_9CAUD|nr:hypothetical protein I5H37_gp085 [Mycobacterium phage Filuzino]AYQ99430.1 hypothetical protein PBI_FILUZINO_85 [Mycobacterium phage Filuzino]
MNAPQHYLDDLARANQVIRDAGALVDFGDGTCGIDPSMLPDEFLDYYKRLRSLGYAEGWLR